MLIATLGLLVAAIAAVGPLALWLDDRSNARHAKIIPSHPFWGN